MPGAVVLLIPDDSRRQQEHLFRRATADDYGGYVLRGVAPGEYFAVAVGQLAPGRELDPAFLAGNKADFTGVELNQNEQKTLDLKLKRIDGQ